MYKVTIYIKGIAITSAKGNDYKELQKWADDVCTDDTEATYIITKEQ